MPFTTNPEHKVKFDGTINLGHILTFLGFVGAGFVAYTAIDTRVTIVELRATVIERTSAEQSIRTEKALDRIGDRLDKIDERLRKP